MISANRLLALLLSILVALAPVSSVVAQEYDAATIEAVNEHFARGEKFFYDEQYEDAIREFRAANDLIPNGIFLYNISVAHERLGQREQALAAAEEADRLGDLGPEEATTNKARIVAMRRMQTAEVASTEVRSVPDPSEGAPFRFTKWGWVGTGTAALGLLMLANVVAIDARLSNEVDAYRQAAVDGNRTEYDRLKSEIDRRQNGARALLVAGSLVFLGGVALVVWDLKFNPANAAAGDVSVGLRIAPDGVAGAFELRF